MKTLLAVFFTMGLVLTVLALLLWADARGWVRDTRAEFAGATLRSLQDWITFNQDKATTPNGHPAWGALSERLAGSALIDEWVFFDHTEKGTWVPAGGSHPGYTETWMQRSAAIEQMYRNAIDSQTMTVRDGWITGLLLYPGGERYLVRVHAPTLSRPYTDSRRLMMLLVGVIGTATLLLVVMIFLLLNRYVLSPLNNLVAASRRVSQGDFEHTVPDPETGDEIDALVKAFNMLIFRIREHTESMQQEIKGTEQKLVAAQRLSSTGTLAAGVAHEINNPLGGLINACRSMKKRGPEHPRSAEYLDLIEDGLLRIQETVQKILTFTPKRVPRTAFHLGTAAAKAASLIQYRFSKRGCELELKIGDEDPLVYGDPGEIQQSILNLMINALDAVDEGNGHIEVFTRFEEQGAVLTVQDNGQGMSEDQLEQCLDPFFTTKEVGKGTGLGLSVVHNIMDNHGGRLEIESELGKGTQIHLVFPILNLDSIPMAEGDAQTIENPSGQV